LQQLTLVEKSLRKVKKKLREIAKIEEKMASGERVEHNQFSKAKKRARFEQELALLEGGQTVQHLQTSTTNRAL